MREQEVNLNRVMSKTQRLLFRPTSLQFVDEHVSSRGCTSTIACTPAN